MANAWCAALNIDLPQLSVVRHHREANTVALLIVALLERGAPMTLDEVAARFEAVAIADFASARRSLGRSRPDKPPLYRVGDHYHLDLHDRELDLWLFRLGLRPPAPVHVPPPKPAPPPLPGIDVRLQEGELDEAWREERLWDWSQQRLVLAVLDALGGPLSPQQVVDAVAARTKHHGVSVDQPHFARKGSAIAVLSDGRWAVAAGADRELQSARKAVRARVELARRYASYRVGPEEQEAFRAAYDRRQAQRSAELASLSRVLLAAFPPDRPQVVVMLDVASRTLTSYSGSSLREVRARLAGYDLLAALEVRALLQALEFDVGERRLAELGPPQKTKRLKHGQVIALSVDMLIRASCFIHKPLSDLGRLEDLLAAGDVDRVDKALRQDLKSLFSLYEYGRLHGCVRLRQRGIDAMLPVPWAYPEETRLPKLARQAMKLAAGLDVVVGPAPDLADPWARALRVQVVQGPTEWRYWLVDPDGEALEEAAVQRARLAVQGQ